MPLLDFWKTNRDLVLTLSIEQILANAGDGILKDQSECSIELRRFFNIVPGDRLGTYAPYCLEMQRGIFVLDRSRFEPFLESIGKKIGRTPRFEVLVATTNIGNTSPRARIIASRVYP